MTETFPCTGCGACCRRIHNLKEYSTILSDKLGVKEIAFPYENKDGVCEKLIDNKCSVYEDRPLICNIDKMQPVLNFNKESFYNMNAKICNDFIKEDNLGENFLINL